MNRVPNNKKVIFLLSALCCLLLVCVNIYQQKTWRSMDLIIFMGQSNMSGAGGDASAAPKLTEGAGYEYRAVTDPDTLHVLEEPFGEKENRGALDDTELLERKGSLVTSFVNAYYEQTNVPVANFPFWYNCIDLLIKCTRNFIYCNFSNNSNTSN